MESIDVDFARVDYGLFTLLRHGISNALQNVEVRSARIVMNPTKAPLRPRPPNPKKKIELPDIFPERVHVADATIIIRNRPQDFIAEHVDVDLDPRRPGEVRTEKLQLVGGQIWLKLAAQATYSNRNLTLRDLVLGDDERFRSINFDASQIAARKLGINFDYRIADGNIHGDIALRESQDSLDTNVRIRSEKVPLSAINKFAALPQDWLRGSLEKFDVDLAGLVSSPATWNGNLTAIVKDFRQEKTAFDRGEFQLIAKNGVASIAIGGNQAATKRVSC